jgi:Major Facilitator Superfamily
MPNPPFMSDPASDAPLLQVERKGILTFAVMGAMIIQILDSTIANVAIPHMQTSLGATLDTISWVLTSYIVASAVAIPITGWVSDRFGSRRLFLIAVGGFILMWCRRKPDANGYLPTVAGHVRGLYWPNVSDDHDGYQPALQPKPGDGTVGPWHHGCADLRAANRGMAHRKL